MSYTVPLYWGEKDDPDRRLIGEAEFDPETGEIFATVTEGQARSDLSIVHDVSMEVNGRIVKGTVESTIEEIYIPNVGDILAPGNVLAPRCSWSVGNS